MTIEELYTQDQRGKQLTASLGLADRLGKWDEGKGLRGENGRSTEQRERCSGQEIGISGPWGTRKAAKQRRYLCPRKRFHLRAPVPRACRRPMACPPDVDCRLLPVNRRCKSATWRTARRGSGLSQAKRGQVPTHLCIDDTRRECDMQVDLAWRISDKNNYQCKTPRSPGKQRRVVSRWPNVHQKTHHIEGVSKPLI